MYTPPPLCYPPPPLATPPLRGGTVTLTDQIPKQLKVPVKSKPSKPAFGAGKRAAQSTCASSSNPQPIPEMPTEHVQEFKVVGTRKKKFHTVPVERKGK